jgi:hypothetical protein
MIKLFIDNQLCDTYTDSIAITRKAYDLSDSLQSRYLGRTNRFTLPKTQNNIQILGRPSILGSDNRPFERKLTARIEDGTILMQGIAILESSNDEYNVQVIELSKEFFDNIKVPLHDIDVEADDFTYGITAYNTLKVPTTSVWLWAGHSAHQIKTTEYTVLSTNSARKIRYTRPWFNVSVVTDKILEAQGWTFDFSTDFTEYETAVISSNHEKFYATNYQKTLSGNFTSGNLTGLDTNDFEETSVSTTSTVLTIPTLKTAFRLRGSVTVDAETTITISATDNDVPTAGSSEQVFIAPINSLELDIFSEFIDLGGSFIDVEITISGDITFNDTLLYTNIEENDIDTLENDPLDGYLIKAHDNLPDISQYDLIVKNFFSMFGGAFNVDNFSRYFDVFAFDKFKKLNSYDWSDKFIQGTEKIETLTNYAQTNYLRYNNDELTYESVGTCCFKIDNVNLPVSQSLINLDFSASSEVTIGTYTLLDMPVYGKDPDVPAQNKRVATAGLRVGIYYYETGATYTLTQFNGLRFDALNAKYFSHVVASLQRSRLVTALFNLNRKDVIGYDFSKCIYVEPLKSHFLVFGINDYIPGEVVEITMLKLEEDG